MNRGSKLAKLEGHTEVINDVKITKNRIVSASSDSTLRIWNYEVNTIPNTTKLQANLSESIVLRGHHSDVYCVQIKSGYIASGGADSMIIIWDLEGNLLSKLNGHLGWSIFLNIQI